MPKAIALSALAVLVISQAYASTCPVTLVSAVGDPDAIVLTLRNSGKLPIRRLEFNCKPARSQAASRGGPCREENALFYPGAELTVRYPYPGAIRQPVVVSLKSAMFSNGFLWKPSKRQPCRTLRVSPGPRKK